MRNFPVNIMHKKSDLITPMYLVLAATVDVVVVVDEFWRSSIIKLLVSFDTSSIFNAVFVDALLPIDRLLILLLLLLLFWLYLSTSLSRTDVGMIADDDDDVGLCVSSYGTVYTQNNNLIRLKKIKIEIKIIKKNCLVNGN